MARNLLQDKIYFANVPTSGKIKTLKEEIGSESTLPNAKKSVKISNPRPNAKGKAGESTVDVIGSEVVMPSGLVGRVDVETPKSSDEEGGKFKRNASHPKGAGRAGKQVRDKVGKARKMLAKRAVGEYKPLYDAEFLPTLAEVLSGERVVNGEKQAVRPTEQILQSQGVDLKNVAPSVKKQIEIERRELAKQLIERASASGQTKSLLEKQVEAISNVAPDISRKLNDLLGQTYNTKSLVALDKLAREYRIPQQGVGETKNEYAKRIETAVNKNRYDEQMQRYEEGEFNAQEYGEKQEREKRKAEMEEAEGQPQPVNLATFVKMKEGQLKIVARDQFGLEKQQGETKTDFAKRVYQKYLDNNDFGGSLHIKKLKSGVDKHMKKYQSLKSKEKPTKKDKSHLEAYKNLEGGGFFDTIKNLASTGLKLGLDYATKNPDKIVEFGTKAGRYALEFLGKKK